MAPFGHCMSSAVLLEPDLLPNPNDLRICSPACPRAGAKATKHAPEIRLNMATVVTYVLIQIFDHIPPLPNLPQAFLEQHGVGVSHVHVTAYYRPQQRPARMLLDP